MLPVFPTFLCTYIYLYICYPASAKNCQDNLKFLFFYNKLVIFHVFLTFKITKSAVINPVLCVIKTYVKNLCLTPYFFDLLCLKNAFSEPAESWNNTSWSSFCCTNSDLSYNLENLDCFYYVSELFFKLPNDTTLTQFDAFTFISLTPVVHILIK